MDKKEEIMNFIENKNKINSKIMKEFSIDQQEIETKANSIINEFMIEINNKIDQEFKPEMLDDVLMSDIEIRTLFDNNQDLDFRKLFFKNAPKHNNDYIIAEKKKW